MMVIFLWPSLHLSLPPSLTPFSLSPIPSHFRYITIPRTLSQPRDTVPRPQPGVPDGRSLPFLSPPPFLSPFSRVQAFVTGAALSSEVRALALNFASSCSE